MRVGPSIRPTEVLTQAADWLEHPFLSDSLPFLLLLVFLPGIVELEIVEVEEKRVLS